MPRGRPPGKGKGGTGRGCASFEVLVADDVFQDPPALDETRFVVSSPLSRVAVGGDSRDNATDLQAPAPISEQGKENEPQK